MVCSACMKKRSCTAIAAARAVDAGARDARSRRLRRIAVRFPKLPSDCPLGELALDELTRLRVNDELRLVVALDEAFRVHEWRKR